MSHDYAIHCLKCGESTAEEFSYSVVDELKEAIREAFYVYLLSHTGWDLQSLTYRGWIGERTLARFLVAHYQCQSFVIRSEYNHADPGKYPDIPVEAWEPVLLTQGAYI